MELFRILGKVAVDNQEANKNLEETSGKAEQTHSKMSTAFSKIGKAAEVAGKAIAAGLAAGATAMGKLIKSSVDGYAEYEQLAGGVDTLFKRQSFVEFVEKAKGSGKTLEALRAEYDQLKQAADVVMKNAANAFKTAGLSANEYMETVTSFSASLLQSLDGDTAAAADKANMAVTDMADNANKMGTSMSMIQTAYQGFAKQNYSMLDNLKLGYGGTAEEMFRLLSEAKELDETFDAEFSLDAKGHLYAEFADIVDAIHIVQTEMGITGTTAKEASSTIQGSVSSMKSAWANFVSGMADESQDFNVLLGNLIDSVVTVANNLIPRLQILLPRLVEGLNQLITAALPYLPAIIETLIPGIITGATSLLTGLIAALPQILQILLKQIPFILSQIGLALVEAFPALLETVKSLFGQIWDYIAVELLGTSACFEDTFAKVEEIFGGVWNALQQTWDSIGKPIWDTVQSAIQIVRDAFSAKMPEIKEFVSGCFSDIKSFWENNLKPCFDAIGDFIENILAPVFESVFKGSIQGTIETVFNSIKNFWNDTLKPVFTGITDFLTGVFTLNWEQAWNGLVSILKGIVNGIINGIETMINSAINAINALIEGINKLIEKAGKALGLTVKIPTIPLVNLPRLEEGGVLEAGQVGLLEGTGAEAVVPLERNKAWISAVAKDMNSIGMGGSEEIRELKEAFKAFVEELPEMLVDAFATLKFDVNNREFARLVKAVH